MVIEDIKYISESSKYKGNQQHFASMAKSFNYEFYDNFLTYFMKRDISNNEPRVTPVTEVKKVIQEISESAHEL